MTDIEKKTYKVTLIRGVAICISLIACTWKLSDVVNRFTNKIEGLEKSINVLVMDKENRSKADSIKDAEIALLKKRVDSNERVLTVVARKANVKLGLVYYHQRRINGKLIEEVIN